MLACAYVRVKTRPSLVGETFCCLWIFKRLCKTIKIIIIPPIRVGHDFNGVKNEMSFRIPAIAIWSVEFCGCVLRRVEGEARGCCAARARSMRDTALCALSARRAPYCSRDRLASSRRDHEPPSAERRAPTSLSHTGSRGRQTTNKTPNECTQLQSTRYQCWTGQEAQI